MEWILLDCSGITSLEEWNPFLALGDRSFHAAHLSLRMLPMSLSALDVRAVCNMDMVQFRGLGHGRMGQALTYIDVSRTAGRPLSGVVEACSKFEERAPWSPCIGLSCKLPRRLAFRDLAEDGQGRTLKLLIEGCILGASILIGRCELFLTLVSVLRSCIQLGICSADMEATAIGVGLSACATLLAALIGMQLYGCRLKGGRCNIDPILRVSRLSCGTHFRLLIAFAVMLPLTHATRMPSHAAKGVDRIVTPWVVEGDERPARVEVTATEKQSGWWTGTAGSSSSSCGPIPRTTFPQEVEPPGLLPEHDAHEWLIDDFEETFDNFEEVGDTVINQVDARRKQALWERLHDFLQRAQTAATTKCTIALSEAVGPATFSISAVIWQLTPGKSVFDSLRRSWNILTSPPLTGA